jgi:PPOX class probable FMN-dependent enzyme
MTQSLELTEITSEAELRDLLGAPMPRSVAKERTALHPLDREWIAASPFLLLATSAADGTCDVSPKGDPAGFVHVIDDTTIAVPERPGNRRADGFLNILSNPHVGLLFLVPGRTDTLRINGRARLLRETPYMDELIVKGHRPQLVIEVAIEQIFHHCAKAFLRSQLWDHETWNPDALPRHACIVKEVQTTTESLEELDEYYRPENYLKKLYAA